MAKQTFTTGQVLTAAQMTSLQQTAMGGGSATAKTASYVLVAADAGTTILMNSASSTTITVNTALFSAGDTVYIQNLGTGVCTITAGTATVNTSASLALAQYEGGQLYFNSTSAAIFIKGAGAAAGGGGKVLQVVSAITSTETQVTSTTFTDSSLTCSITPTLTSSKILVLTSQVFGIGQSNDSAFTGAALILLRGSTTVYRPGSSSNYEWSQGTTRKFTNPIVYLDSPATTSSITYKTQIKLLGTPAGASVTAQSGTAESSIVLMEIGA